MIKGWIRDRRVGGAALCVMCGLVAVSMGHLIDKGRSSATASTISWTRVVPRPISVRLGLVGSITPATRLTLIAPFSGNVASLSAIDGQQVSQSDTLLVLDTTQIDIQVREALADLIKAQRSLEDAKNWDRSPDVNRARRTVATAQLAMADIEQKLADTKALFSRGIVPRMELESLEQQEKLRRMDLNGSQSDLEALRQCGAKNSVRLAEMEVENARSRYEDRKRVQASFRIAAPFPGVTGFVTDADGSTGHAPLAVGSHVNEGEALLTLSSVRVVRAVASVNETDVSQLEPGQSVDVDGDGFDGILLRGHIAAIGAEASNSSGQAGAGNYKVEVSLPQLTADQAKRVLLGMSARLSVVVYQNDSAIIVPPTAVVSVDGKSFVFYRKSVNAPVMQIAVRTGHPTPDGVEVFGVPAGEVEAPAGIKP